MIQSFEAIYEYIEKLPLLLRSLSYTPPLTVINGAVCLFTVSLSVLLLAAINAFILVGSVDLITVVVILVLALHNAEYKGYQK